jgi:hypothetical protein
VDVSSVPVSYYGEGVNFASNYFAEVDVDPAVTPQFTGRTSGLYNASDFNRTGPLAQGRVTEFAFSKMRGWDGDLDRDGVRGEASEDKFPARCRVFSNFTVYGQYTGRTFPNNIPDPTTFVEGGCYLADTGPKVLGITVSDDPTQPDPGQPGAVVTGTAPNWTVTLNYRVDASLGNYTVEFNPNYPSGTWQTILSSNGDGAKSTVVNFTLPASPPARTFALRATDTVGVSPIFFWPTQVNVVTPPIFGEDFDTLGAWTLLTPGGTQTGAGAWGVVASALTVPSAQGGSGNFACCNVPVGTYADFSNRAIQMTNAVMLPAGQLLDVSFYTAGNCEDSWDGVLAQIDLNNANTYALGSQSGYWDSMSGNDLNGFYNGNNGATGLTAANSFGFSGSGSGSGMGTTWVKHTKQIGPFGAPTPFKMRFWFASDSSFGFSPGACVDTLRITAAVPPPPPFYTDNFDAAGTFATNWTLGGATGTASTPATGWDWRVRTTASNGIAASQAGAGWAQYSDAAGTGTSYGNAVSRSITSATAITVPDVNKDLIISIWTAGGANDGLFDGLEPGISWTGAGGSYFTTWPGTQFAFTGFDLWTPSVGGSPWVKRTYTVTAPLPGNTLHLRFTMRSDSASPYDNGMGVDTLTLSQP